MKVLTLILCAFCQVGTLAWLQTDSKSPDSDKVIQVKAFRASTIVGMKVKNTAEEDLGEVSELVLDVESGKVLYAALSVGGVLGVGDKLMAVPWTEFKLKHEEKDTYFVLDIAKEKMEAAPGFDEDNWPDVADQKWREEVDRYYQKAREPGRETPAPKPR